MAEVYFPKGLPLFQQTRVIDVIKKNQDLSNRLQINKACYFDFNILNDQEFLTIKNKFKLQAFYADKSIYLPASLIEQPEKLYKSIRHEMVHALLDCKYQQSTPVWLEEGLAYYFTNDLKQLKPLPVEFLQPLNILKTSFSNLDANNRKLAYLQSKHLFNYLLKITNLSQVYKYLSLVNKKDQLAFAKSFAISEADFFKNFSKWLNQQNKTSRQKS